MNDLPTTPLVDTSYLRKLTHIAYSLYALGIITGGLLGIATLASVVLIYIKRESVAGTLYGAHFDWLLRTFWWGLFWLALSSITTLIFIGWVGFIVVLGWILYRLIKGWLALFESRLPTSYQ